MRLSLPSLLLPALLASPAVLQAQIASPPTASSLLTPALDTLRQSVGNLRLDKWKAPGAVRQEANSNIGSITRDLDGTLPGLLTTADAAPGVISQNLPVFRNVDALYDVLLRVVETADLSAPEGDTDSLHHALTALDDARRSLGDAMEASAVGQEKRLATLEDQARAQTATPHPVPTAPVTPGSSAKPAATTPRKHKPAAKPPARPPAAQAVPQ